MLAVPTTTVVTTTTTTTPPISTDMTLIGTSSPRVSLLEGSSLCPAVIATFRPRTWMQQLTEGQTTEPQREGTSSSEHELSLVETLQEEIPDKLGHEWRVLHQFDLPGVRFPTNTTPSNQRCLAENDALVELIQTREYLDDVPTWGQRDYRLYLPRYGDPFYRGRGRGGQGRREWLLGRQMERPERGFAREIGQDNTTRPQQPTSTDRPAPIRQEDEWSISPPVERRDDAVNCQIALTSSPAAPPPTEERLFTDWSSEGSPRDRNNQRIQSARSVEPRTEPVIRESEGEQAIRHVLSDVSTTPSIRVQTEQVSTRFVDREINTSVVDIRPPEGQARADLIHAHSIGIQVPSASSELSSSIVNEGDFMAGTHLVIRLPQLDGPTSVHVKRKQLTLMVRERTTIPGGDYPSESESDSHDSRFRESRRYPRRKWYHQGKSGKLPDKQGRGYPRRGRPPNDRGPPDDGGPPDDRGPPGNGGPPRRPRGQGPPGPPRPPGPVHPIIVQQPQVTLYTTVLENTFDTVGQSMLQLARAQDQTNRYLQEHLQQGQMNMQAHTGALQQLATSTYQWNFDHIFTSIPIYDGSNREDFFPWLERLEAACYYSGRNIKTEALGRSAGPVQNVIMALPDAHSWKAIREELKRCFSDQTSLGHAALSWKICHKNLMNH